MVGNGVTQNNYSPDLTVNSQSQYGITNTIAVNAETGDAVVSNNTNAGNAVSGSAKAMANIANVTGSQFSASDWFGVLFINVFDTWFGSFGVDTPYGNTPTVETPTPQNPIEFRPAETSAPTETKLRVIDSRGFSRVAVVAAAVADMVGEGEQMEAEDLAEFSGTSTLGATDRQVTPASQDDYRLLIIAGSILVVGASVIGLRRLLS